MTYYTLTLDALAASTLDELAAMEMGRPPLAMPYVVSVVTCGVCGHVVYSFSK